MKHDTSPPAGTAVARIQRSFAGRLLCGAVLAILLAGNAPAQVSEQRTHCFNDYDVKNYSMAVLPGTAITMLAGTAFLPSGETSLHLMLSDNTTIPGNTYVTRIYDEPGFDERAIDAHFWRGNVDDLIIVGSRRDVSGGPMVIEVLHADGWGWLQRGDIISDKMGDNLYPLGTMLKDDDLYICGYTTVAGSPWTPDYRTEKELFVIRYNIAQRQVTKSFRHNYPTMAGRNDYDMATRIKVLQNGHIFVTGSCNVDNPAAPGYSSTYEGYYCGTLSLTLDNDLNIIYDEPISAYLPVVGGQIPNYVTARGEAGFDITEDPNGDGYFIFSNTFVAEPQTPIPLMNPIHITFVDNNMQVPPAKRNRFRGSGFDIVWGVNLVEGNTPASTILSGYQTSRPGLNTPFPTLPSNINPFLTELKLEYTGVININALYFSTILSREGTGDPLLYTNNFSDLGGYFSNLAWAPPNARRDLTGSPQRIFLSAPIWNPDGFSKLNMKMIHALNNGSVTCPIDYKYAVGGDVIDTWPGDRGGQTPDIAESIHYHSEQDYDLHLDNLFSCDNASGVFKGTDIQNPGIETVSCVLAPNPAAGQVVARISGLTSGTALRICLSDMTGRQIDVLYEGHAAAGTHELHLKLPDLAKGLYLLSVSDKSRTLSTQKLEIK